MATLQSKRLPLEMYLPAQGNVCDGHDTPAETGALCAYCRAQGWPGEGARAEDSSGLQRSLHVGHMAGLMLPWLLEALLPDLGAP